jgi:hypothetical protein
MLEIAFSSRRAWAPVVNGSVQAALSNWAPRRFGFLMPLDLAAQRDRCVRSPDAEGRTSGAEKGWPGAIPARGPDPQVDRRIRFFEMPGYRKPLLSMPRTNPREGPLVSHVMVVGGGRKPI